MLVSLLIMLFAVSAVVVIAHRVAVVSLPFWLGNFLILLIAAGIFSVGFCIESSLLKQCGAAALFILLLLQPALINRRLQPGEAIQKGIQILARAVTFSAIFFLSGEAFLRIAFHDGESFGTKAGPIVEKFERDFQFNSYDGPSRGPDLEANGSQKLIRILMQGDSITWGQGIRDEADLFSEQMLQGLREHWPDIQMAVLAKPGREIDGHVEQLRKWGPTIDPDIIVYVWFLNDIELGVVSRPAQKGRIWRKFVLHPLLISNSYFWFLMDFALDRALPSGVSPYDAYVRANYVSGTGAWKHFEREFNRWLAEARQYTSIIIVAIYPMLDNNAQPILQEIYSQFEALCESRGISVVDLWPELEPLAEKPDVLFASPFDSHPGPEAHRRIAEVLVDRVAPIAMDLGAAPR